MMKRIKLVWKILTIDTGGIDEIYDKVCEMHHWWRLSPEYRAMAIFRDIHNHNQKKDDVSLKDVPIKIDDGLAPDEW